MQPIDQKDIPEFYVKKKEKKNTKQETNVHVSITQLEYFKD